MLLGFLGPVDSRRTNHRPSARVMRGTSVVSENSHRGPRPGSTIVLLARPLLTRRRRWRNRRRVRRRASGRSVYNYFRDYDAVTGRYLESDPIGLEGGINTYAYAGGNTVSNADPLGLECISSAGGMRCIYPGGPDFRVPAPPGQPSFMGPNNFLNFFLYHRYDVQVPLDGADERCVMRKLIENPTPGTPSPATPSASR